MKGATFRRVSPPVREWGYDLPKLNRLSKKKLRELRMATERQCRNGGAFDRPGITAADLLSLLKMLADERQARLDDIEDQIAVMSRPGVIGRRRTGPSLGP